MDDQPGPRKARHTGGWRWLARRWRSRLVIAGSLACIVATAAAPTVAAWARPAPGGYGDLVGRWTWSGWSLRTPRPPTSVLIWLAWPHVECGGADGAWHATNVSVTCTAFDLGSGLADPADASFALSTNVPADTEEADASTGSRLVCNAIGICVVAEPESGHRVDRLAPEFQTTDPVAARYELGARVQLRFRCTDAGSGVLECPAPVLLDTARTGRHSRSFHASDAVGNVATATIAYTVVAVCVGGRVARPTG